MTMDLTKLTLFTIPATLALSAIVVWVVWSDNAGQRELIQQCLANTEDQVLLKASVTQILQQMPTYEMTAGIQTQLSMISAGMASRKEVVAGMAKLEAEIIAHRKRIYNVEVAQFQTERADE